MAKQLGRSLLLKIGDGGGTEVFSALAGINSKTLTINNSLIDVTTPDASSPSGALWSASLNGLKQVALSGDGVFLDETAEARLNTVAMQADPVANFEIVVPDFGSMQVSYALHRLNLVVKQRAALRFQQVLKATAR